MKLKDTVAMITGAGSGIGMSVARKIVAAGGKAALLDINVDNVKDFATEINALAISCDVTKEDDVTNAIAQIRDELGEIRVGINCAGILHAARVVGKKGPMPLADFSKVINVNVLGTFNIMSKLAAVQTTTEAVNADNERGVIINVASIAAFEGQVGQVAYSASKGAIVAMTLPAARELARFGIRVVTVAPGLVDTPMLSSLPAAAYESLQESTVFPKRLGKPEEIADFMLAVIQNPLLNGSAYRLDGAIRLASK